jgi:hypothetical protein
MSSWMPRFGSIPPSERPDSAGPATATTTRWPRLDRVLTQNERAGRDEALDPEGGPRMRRGVGIPGVHAVLCPGPSFRGKDSELKQCVWDELCRVRFRRNRTPRGGELPAHGHGNSPEGIEEARQWKAEELTTLLRSPGLFLPNLFPKHFWQRKNGGRTARLT